MANTYFLGQSVKVAAAFTAVDNVTAADPTTVRLEIKQRSSVETEFLYGAVDAVIQRAGVGSYWAVVDANLPGSWAYRWRGVTGTATPTAEGTFSVSRTGVTVP